MGTIERLAEKLADDTLKVQDATGEDRLYMEVGGVLAAASQSLEEAFLTEMRVRLAERTARKFLNQKISEAKAAAEEALERRKNP
jgi:3-methyladenine DNA glycosylase/8-oxoguanine DNA glycosylase